MTLLLLGKHLGVTEKEINQLIYVDLLFSGQYEILHKARGAFNPVHTIFGTAFGIVCWNPLIN